MEADQNRQLSEVRGALGFKAGSRVAGEPSIPRSKSIAQRHLLCAALAEGTTQVVGLAGGEDIAAAISLLQALGVSREQVGSGLVVRGSDRAWPQDGKLDLGESGTLARFATAAAALCAPASLELAPRGSLSKRSSPALFDCLRRAGVQLVDADGEDTNGWPVRVTPAAGDSRLELRQPGSSQEVSALLIALAARASESALVVLGEIPSRPYLDLTIAVLADFGVQVVEAPCADGCTFTLSGPLVAPGRIRVESDASAAAVALAAACLSGGEVFVRGLGSDSGTRQGDVRIVELLSAAGCVATREAGGLRAHGAPDRVFDLDLTGEPDLAPVLAAVAAFVAWRAPKDAAPCRLRGLETLPGKESSRIEVLARGLTQLGFAVEFDNESLQVARGDAPDRERTEPIFLDPANDHRMAFCFALCSLFVPNVFVLQPECTGKSWPKFWRNLSDSGAQLESA